MREASEELGWNLDLGQIILGWRGGCIIRAKFLHRIAEALERNPELPNLLLDPYFRIDCHSLFSTHSAMKLAERLEPFDLMFLEDPVPNDNNVEAMSKVTAATSIPICTGEFLFPRDGFSELIQAQACDMLHVDVSGTGGILEAKKIAYLADLYYIPFAAHNITSPIGMTATAHVCAAVGNFILVVLCNL